jgi:hypothetical protein
MDSEAYGAAPEAAERMCEMKIILFILLSLELAACSSSPVRRKDDGLPTMTGRLSRFSGIRLGESVASLKQKLGEPSSLSSEKYGGLEFRVLAYNTSVGSELAFFSVDANDQVVGESVWIAKEQKESDLEWLTKNYFSNFSFETYYPCKITGHQKFLIDRSHGVLIGVEEGKVIYLSQSSLELTNLRIADFYNKCPQVQERTR